MAAVPAGIATALQDRYRLDRELGHGGMATVYLAQDLKHDRQVALKVLRPELAAVLGRERFLAEIRLTAKLDHPHILTLLDSGESDGFVWYSLPYIRGESLRDKIKREQAALAASRRRYYIGWGSGIYGSTPESLREEGRLAALTGDRPGAIRAYTSYLALRGNSDYAPWQASRDSVRAGAGAVGGALTRNSPRLTGLRTGSRIRS